MDNFHNHALTSVHRRTFLRLLAAAGATGLASACSAPAATSSPTPAPAGQATTGTSAAAQGTSAPASRGPLKSLKLGVGTLANSTMQQAFRYYDEKNKIINQVGKDYGYDLDVHWLEFPVAPEEFAAFQSGDLSIGPMATFPLVGQLKKHEPYGILTNSLGMFPFMLMVKKGGPITKVEDLAGKTVGMALGTAHQFIFENFVIAETGKTSKDLGIKLASQPIPVPNMPKGLDAYQTFSPAILPALENPQSDIQPLYQLSAPAQTGPAYDGPLGKGAGIAIPSAKKSPWYPEGYIALRNPFTVRGPFLKSNPDVVTAFVVAHQKVIRLLHTWSTTQITDLYPSSSWDVMPRKAFEQQSLGNDLLYKERDWVWPTEALLKDLLGESQQMVQIGVQKDPLSIDDAHAAFDGTIPILKAAYEATGSYPADSVFTQTGVRDLRGLPIWKVDFAKYKNFDISKTTG